MKITVLGATGGTGTEFVRQALRAGHQVTAVVRDPARLAVDRSAGLEVVRADATDAAALDPVIKGRDAVVSALGHRGPGTATLLVDAARSVATAMTATGVRRFVVVSAAGAFPDAADGPIVRYVVKPLILEAMFRRTFHDTRLMERYVSDTDLDWTIVRPPRLTNGRHTGSYRTATDLNVRGGRQISRANLADCILRSLADPASVRHVIGVAH